MINKNKSSEAYRTIGEVTKDLGLIDKKTGNLQTHTIRYWETQFKQIKPDIRAGNRRYYSNKTYKVIEYIKFLLKDKGLTINGAKKILSNSKTDSIDADINNSINTTNIKITENIKKKVKNISKLISELKKIK
tara:strand:- start:820 stop:1218 length:399 start_codon:yes stop_codon:yes gene_type:complete